MSASLVGSEMCIRDRFQAVAQSLSTPKEQAQAEIVALQEDVGTTRKAMEELHTSWQSEFSGLRDLFRVQLNRAEDLATGVGSRLQALEDG
eukprot:7241736-Alexandrium_andersonii.AAC.1